MYRIFYPTAVEYTFFPVAHRFFSKITFHEASLNKYKKMEITSVRYPTSRIKLEINNKRNSWSSNSWTLNSKLLNDHELSKK
jgi:hypothetical protein